MYPSVYIYTHLYLLPPYLEVPTWLHSNHSFAVLGGCAELLSPHSTFRRRHWHPTPVLLLAAQYIYVCLFLNVLEIQLSCMHFPLTFFFNLTGSLRSLHMDIMFNYEYSIIYLSIWLLISIWIVYRLLLEWHCHMNIPECVWTCSTSSGVSPAFTPRNGIVGAWGKCNMYNVKYFQQSCMNLTSNQLWTSITCSVYIFIKI